ncbi:MAG: hypothetical protein Unbinned4120contig1000_3 [Prokaryotic dsDNA virus sp.]|jgi:hypothetical protein|nr:MAG: hypothetical protein Unbinned4120contig1000_3 [Prokaryotic dsDNA virus sp.]|tara:strand:- start:1210 stop:1980 length:771 start_codon:yes stop_codon:yes gene_type:complete
MGNPFNNLNTDGMEETGDRLGGYSALESGIYTGKIKAAYAGQSSGGAHNMTVILEGGDFGSTEYRETIYVTNKKGENFYLNKNDKTKKVPLPGFTTVEDLCLATVGKPLSEIDFEDKVMNIYDYEAQKELPKSVPMAVELIGQEVSVAILKTIENQTEKDGAGNYVPKADGSTREVNNIDKVFNTATKMTVAEAKGGAKEPEFWDKWDAKNTGETRDKTTNVGGNAGRPGGGNAPQAGGNASGNAPRTSLFGGGNS